MQCSHCSREVKETRHTQKGYQVDYYLVHTGLTEWVFLKHPKEDAPSLHYLKLTQPVDIISCVECCAKPQISRRLQEELKSLEPTVDKKQMEGLKENSAAEANHG
jgi:hypothetical protein